MQFGPVIDTAIGLVLIYVTLSLVVTTILEFVAAAFNVRGQTLLAAIDQLTVGLPTIVLPPDSATGQTQTIGSVSAHPLVKGMAAKTEAYPSYVEAGNFAMAVLDHLGAYGAAQAPQGVGAKIASSVASISDPSVRRVLQTFVNQAAGDITALRASLVGWFNGAMDRVSGDYKRWSQWVSIVIGITVAVLVNASSIDIVRQLWTDDGLRAAMVAAASATKLPDSTPAPQVGAAIKAYDGAAATVANLPIPLGWTPQDFAVDLSLGGAAHLVVRVMGLLITGLALSLGAPFWFDTLQQLINLRNSGPKPGAKKKKR